MVLDVVAGAVLLAFGILAVYLSVESSNLADARFLIVFLVGVALALGGFWIIVTKITIAVLLTKAAGIILVLVGFFLIVEFPDIRDYQMPAMSNTGILIGLVLLILGIYLLIFA